MRAVVVYESMFGCTRRVADAIARGLGERLAATVVAVGQASPDMVAGAGLVVVGGPTHMHSMSRPVRRRMAVSMAHKPDGGLALEPGADGVGLREWFADELGRLAASRPRV